MVTKPVFKFIHSTFQAVFFDWKLLTITMIVSGVLAHVVLSTSTQSRLVVFSGTLFFIVVVSALLGDLLSSQDERIVFYGGYVAPKASKLRRLVFLLLALTMLIVLIATGIKLADLLYFSQ